MLVLLARCCAVWLVFLHGVVSLLMCPSFDVNVLDCCCSGAQVNLYVQEEHALCSPASSCTATLHLDTGLSAVAVH